MAAPGRPGPPPKDRGVLLGPRLRRTELRTLLRVSGEMLRGFRALHFVGPCVTVFGSARVRPGEEGYESARRLGGELSRLGYGVVTGGGPGMMEAANRGAREAGGRSIGCTIQLEHEEEPNPYLDVEVDFEYFFVRKFMLIKYSYAFVVMPGGFGTADELFEALTLIQNGKIHDFPVVLMGRSFWQPLEDMLRRMLAERMIDAADLDLLRITDDLDDAIEHIRARTVERFRLAEKLRPVRAIGEARARTGRHHAARHAPPPGEDGTRP